MWHADECSAAETAVSSLFQLTSSWRQKASVVQHVSADDPVHRPRCFVLRHAQHAVPREGGHQSMMSPHVGSKYHICEIDHMACAFRFAVCASDLRCLVALRPPLFLPAHRQLLSPPEGLERSSTKPQPAGFSLQIRTSCCCAFTPPRPASAATGSRSEQLRRHPPAPVP